MVSLVPSHAAPSGRSSHLVREIGVAVRAGEAYGRPRSADALNGTTLGQNLY
jgi:hypothetical protein